MKTLSYRPDRRSGFTLVEIMLVVVIIGLIAAIGLPKITGQSERARYRTAEAQIKNLATSVMQFEMDIGTFPTSLDQLINSSGSTKWDGPYTENGKLPKDPWGNDYTYTMDGRSFEIKSGGAPGKNKPISNRD